MTALSDVRQRQREQLIENAKRGIPLIENFRSVGIGHRQAVEWLTEVGLHTVVPCQRRQVEPSIRNKALAMWQQGIPVRQIAKEIGVTERTIRNWAGDAGLTRAPYMRTGTPTLGALKMREYRLRKKQELAAQDAVQLAHTTNG